MPHTPIIIRSWRIARILVHTLIGLLLAAVVLPVSQASLRRSLIQWWCRHLLACFNLTVTASGQRPTADTRGVMFVANHISWSDIHAINSLIPVRFVAKVEIKDWPVFGYLVRKSGTLFINRNRQRDAARVVHLCSHALQFQDNLCVFPEGTTTEGYSVLPFKSSLIQAAISANSWVVPIAIRYPLPEGGINVAAAYAGDTSLGTAMGRVLNMRAPTVHLHFCPPIKAADYTRQVLAQMAHQHITDALAAWPSTNAETAPAAALAERESQPLPKHAKASEAQHHA